MRPGKKFFSPKFVLDYNPKIREFVKTIWFASYTVRRPSLGTIGFCFLLRINNGQLNPTSTDYIYFVISIVLKSEVLFFIHYMFTIVYSSFVCRINQNKIRFGSTDRDKNTEFSVKTIRWNEYLISSIRPLRNKYGGFRLRSRPLGLYVIAWNTYSYCGKTYRRLFGIVP